MTNDQNDTDLLAPLRRSFSDCVQFEVPPDARALRGIHGAFAFGMPIFAADGRAFLTYESYSFDPPRHDALESLRLGMTFAAPIKLTLRMWIASPKAAELPGGGRERPLFEALAQGRNDPALRAVYGDFLEEHGRADDARDVRQRGVLLGHLDVQDIKEQEIYFGELPLMTEDGAFVVSGERRRLIVGEADGVRAPMDGAQAPPRRLVMPGDWITHAFVLALEKLRTRLSASISRQDVGALETLMPHDLVDARDLFSALRKLFKRPAAAALDERGNLVSIVEALLSRGDLAESLVPFAAGDAAVLASGAKALRQAATLVSPTLPCVRTREELRVGAAAGVPRAPFDATAQRLAGDDTLLLLWPRGQPSDHPPLASEVVFSADPFARDAAPFSWVFRKQDGDLVRRGEALADADGVLDGHLALGREALVVFDSKAKGATVSNAFAEAMASSQPVEHEIVLRDTRGGPEELVSLASAPHLDEAGIVRVGARCRGGDVLVGKATWGGLEDRSRDPVRVDASYRLPGDPDDGAWTVLNVQFFRRPGTEPTPREQAARDASVARHHAVARMAGERGGDLAAEVADRALDAASLVGARDYLPPGVIRIVRVVVARRLPLRVGDAISDRRGFGAKVARILAAAEMPKVMGEPADVILPTARLPHGSILEARLSLAGRLLEESFSASIESALVDATCERARLPVTATAPKEGALYVLRRRDKASPKRVRG